MMQRAWLHSYGNVPPQINADVHTSIVALPEQAMVRHADKTEFRSFGQRLSCRDVDQLSARFAAFLQHELNVGNGDRVAFQHA
jgi:long-chain acyl-CoA synthetase